MTRRPYARALTALIALVVLGISVPARRSSAISDAAFALAPATIREVVLPPGFNATVDRSIRDQFVRVVAGDVDDDGDLDVVASLGSLDLAIWRNDGAGHFTRVPSSRHLAFQTQPPAPAVGSDLIESHESIQNGDPRGVDLASRRARASNDPASPLAPPALTVIGRFGPRPRSSRAPPRA